MSASKMRRLHALVTSVITVLHLFVGNTSIMDKLIISGGSPLSGSVQISGAKNAVLPILVATLLCDDAVTLENVPHLNDVTTTMTLLGRMGVRLTLGDKMQIEADASGVDNCCLLYTSPSPRDQRGSRMPSSA